MANRAEYEGSQKPPDHANLVAGDYVVRAVGMVGANRLAGIEPGRTVVFSTNPTPTQQRLGGPSALLYERYMRAYLPIKTKENEQAAKESARFRTGSSPSTPRPKPPAVLDRGFAALTVKMKRSSAECSLMFYDQTGDVVGQGSTTLQAKYDATPADIDSETAPPFVRSEAGLALRKAWRYGYSEDPLSEQAMAQFLDPEKHDILEGSASDAVLYIAKAHHANLVAVLPDAMVNCGSGIYDRLPYSKGAVAAAVRMVLDKKAGWLTASPRFRKGHRQPNYPRDVLAAMGKNVVARGGLSFETFLAHVKASMTTDDTETAPNELADIANGAIDRYAFDRLGREKGWEMYVLLTPTQRKAAANGLKLRAGELTKAQREVVDDLLFNSSQLRFYTRPLPGNNHPLSVPQALSIPSVALPNGLPPDTTIKLTFTTEPWLQARTLWQSGLVSIGPLSTNEIASDRWNAERGRSSDQRIQAFQEGRRTAFDFEFDFGPLGELHDNAVFIECFPKGRWHDLSQLPQWAKDEIAEQLEEYRNDPTGDDEGSGLP